MKKNEVYLIILMESKVALDIIKSTVRSYLPEARILLFGSRARGDDDKQSDFDILIVTPATVDEDQKKVWRNLLNKMIIKAIQAPVDIIVNSEQEIEIKKTFPGHIIQLALKEGVWL